MKAYEAHRVHISFSDLNGQHVHFGELLTIYDPPDNNGWYRAHAASAIFTVSEYDIINFCKLEDLVLPRELKESKCESSQSLYKISPAIKNWLSTLPIKG